MSRMRSWCAAVSLAPMALLTSHVAGATQPASSPVSVGQVSVNQTAVSAAANLTTHRLLPKGIHRTKTGRYTRDLCDHSKSHYCMAHTLMPVGWTPDQPVPPRVRQGNSGGGGGGGGGMGSGMGPTDVQAAYNIPSSAAANGKIVAILDGPDSSAAADIAAYRSAYGLPPLPKCAGGTPTGSLPACFGQVNEDGSASTGDDAGEDSDAETSLDMDMISAACPDCSILLVEIGGSQGNIQDSDFVTGVETAASLGAVATSISIGGPEEGNDPTGHYTQPGHLVLAASGDFGYLLEDEPVGEGNTPQLITPSYPASAPDILAVGGTTLFNNGSSYDEAVWDDGEFTADQNGEGQDVTTSGCSTEYSTPSWQVSAIAGSGCSMRATADLSAAAAFVTGGQLADIEVYQGGWLQGGVEGTSASSPMVAAILTRLGLAVTVSNNMGWIYSNPSGFNDLGSSSYPVDSNGSSTDAEDPSSCKNLCSVATGWDGPSGVGTPNGTALAALAGGGTSPTDGGTGTGTPDTGTTTGTPDTGTTTGTPDTGTTTGTPDTGTGTGTGTGPGTGTVDSGLGGATPPPGSMSGALGANCTSGTECIGGICAAPSPGAASVCTQSCVLTDGGSTCLPGFTCTFASATLNVCFASPTTTIVVGDGGTAAADGGISTTGSSGCSIAAHDESNTDWTSVGLFAAGTAILFGRKRRQAA